MSETATALHATGSSTSQIVTEQTANRRSSEGRATNELPIALAIAIFIAVSSFIALTWPERRATRSNREIPALLDAPHAAIPAASAVTSP